MIGSHTPSTRRHWNLKFRPRRSSLTNDPGDTLAKTQRMTGHLDRKAPALICGGAVGEMLKPQDCRRDEAPMQGRQLAPELRLSVFIDRCAGQDGAILPKQDDCSLDDFG